MNGSRIAIGLWALTAAAIAPAAAEPVVVGQARLSALPVALANGPAGPLNRIAFDVRRFDLREAGSAVTCLYADGTAHRCAAEPDPTPSADGSRRVRVTIPDLGRGPRVIVRFHGAAGRQDVPIQLENGPRLVHEIEALALPEGGARTTRGDGVEVPVRQLATYRATTVPAFAAAPDVPSPQGCERIYAEWVGASATDAVFASPFGPLNGSLTLARVARGAKAGPEALPEWLIAYPLGATRVQFIAHYEVVYRVAPCGVARQAAPVSAA